MKLTYIEFLYFFYWREVGYFDFWLSGLKSVVYLCVFVCSVHLTSHPLKDPSTETSAILPTTVLDL